MIFWCGWLLFAWITGFILPPVIWFASRKLTPATEARTAEWPLVSIIVPAKDEEQAIENSMRSLLQLDYPQLQIIAVNDRSQDQTGAILDRMAQQDSRCHVIHIKELPDNWLGKNHAMHQASQAAQGQLLLFCDGDVIHQKNSLTDAVSYLQQHKLQHLCLLPKMLPGSVLENALVAFFGLAACAGQQVHLIQTRFPFSYAGVGAFNLIDAQFYRSFGGHQPIAMDVLDDMRLGKLVKRHFGRQDFLAATNHLSLRWYHSTWDMIRGLEKNGFASLDYSIFRIATFALLFCISFIVPILFTIYPTWPNSSGYVMTCITWIVAYIIAAKTIGSRLSVIPLLPVAAILVNFAFWRSAWLTLKQGGVNWRDSFYSLQQLRNGLYK